MDAQILNLDQARSARNTVLLTSKSFHTPLDLDGLAQQQAAMFLSATSFFAQYTLASISFHAQVMSAGYWQCLKSQKDQEKPLNWL